MKPAIVAVASAAVVISLTGCTGSITDRCAQVAQSTYKYAKLLDQASVNADRVRTSYRNWSQPLTSSAAL